MRRNNIFWGLFIILLGALFLLQARGIIANAFSFIFPLALILIGGWFILSVFWQPTLSDSVTFSVPLESAKSVKYKFSHGVGQIQMSGGAPAGQAIVGSSAAGSKTESRMDGDRLNVEVDAGPSIIPFIGPSSGIWRYQLTQEVPVALEINAGASSLDVDLMNVLATRVEVSMGASTLNLTLPARGTSLLDVDAGAASVNIRVPQGVAARVRFEGGLSGINVDEARFPKIDTGFYQSADFDSAADRAEISLDGGLASVTVK